MLDSECVHFLGGSEENEQPIANGKNVKKAASRGAYHRSPSGSGAYTTWEADKDEVEVGWVNYEQMGGGLRPSCLSGPKGLVVKLLFVLVVFLLGMLAGFVLRRNTAQSDYHMPPPPRPAERPDANSSGQLNHTDYFSTLRKLIDAESIKTYLTNFSSTIHFTGPKNNLVLQQTLTQHFKTHGLNTQEFHYNVLLSHPKWEREESNFVSILDSNGSETFHSWQFTKSEENMYHPDIQVTNAFSGSGVVTADVVYANFGEEADFQQLKNLSISCADRIVFMRYGRIYRGLKVARAAERGAVGVVLFTDQSNVTGVYTTPADLYPNTWWLQGDAAQGGSVLGLVQGDPLTPGLPSVPGVEPMPVDNVELPKIPVHSLGYDEAQQVLKDLTGPDCPEDFMERLPKGSKCHVGPGFGGSAEDSQVRLSVEYEAERRGITNVVGTFEGSTEPDRYILIGCHYDALTYGAVDPGSGMAVLAELARVLGLMSQQGWRPRRTIKLIYWDAEEPGLMGSYEWVEDLHSVLWDRAVVYLNLDGLIQGNDSLSVQASPLLHQVIRSASRLVAAPTGGGSMFDRWKEQSPSHVPSVTPLTPASDHAPFVSLLGLPSLWPRHMYNLTEYPINTYPAYHTRLDRLEYVLNFTDPGLVTHARMCELVGVVTLCLASEEKLPMDITELKDVLEQALDELESRILQLGVGQAKQMEELHWAIANFSAKAIDFKDTFETLNISDEWNLRRFNDRLVQVSRTFIYPERDANKSAFRNVLFSLHDFDQSGGMLFGGVHSALTSWSRSTDPDSKQTALVTLQRELSLAVVSVRAATRSLTDELLV